MDGWRGLVAVGVGLVIGVGLWLGLAEIVPASPDSRRLAAVEAPPASPDSSPPGAADSAGVTGTVSAVQMAPRPFDIASHGDDLEALLTSAPYVHRGLDGPVLYVVTFRSCPACVIFMEREWAALEAAGIDIRWIVYARRDAGDKERSLAPERALVADIALKRDYTLLDRWLKSDPAEFYQQTDLPPPANSSPDRKSALESTRALVDALNTVTSVNGVELSIPAFFWQAGENWHGFIGYDEGAFAEVKAELLAEPQSRPAAGTAASDSR